MIKGLVMLTTALCLLSTPACNFLKPNSWELTYNNQDDFTGKTIIKIGTKDCYYEAETGVNNESAKIKWESTSEKLQALFDKVAAHQLQNAVQSTDADAGPRHETLKLVQNGKTIFFIEKNKQTKELASHFHEVVILMRMFSMEEQGWKF